MLAWQGIQHQCNEGNKATQGQWQQRQHDSSNDAHAMTVMQVHLMSRETDILCDMPPAIFDGCGIWERALLQTKKAWPHQKFESNASAAQKKHCWQCDTWTKIYQKCDILQIKKTMHEIFFSERNIGVIKEIITIMGVYRSLCKNQQVW